MGKRRGTKVRKHGEGLGTKVREVSGEGGGSASALGKLEHRRAGRYIITQLW